MVAEQTQRVDFALDFSGFPGVDAILATHIGGVADELMAMLSGIDFNRPEVVYAVSELPIRSRTSINFGRITPIEQRINFRAYRPISSGIVFI